MNIKKECYKKGWLDAYMFLYDLVWYKVSSDLSLVINQSDNGYSQIQIQFMCNF